MSIKALPIQPDGALGEGKWHSRCFQAAHRNNWNQGIRSWQNLTVIAFLLKPHKGSMNARAASRVRPLSKYSPGLCENQIYNTETRLRETMLSFTLIDILKVNPLKPTMVP